MSLLTSEILKSDFLRMLVENFFNQNLQSSVLAYRGYRHIVGLRHTIGCRAGQYWSIMYPNI